MPTVLIVDDSAVDRELAGGLLRRDTELTIEYAEDGRSGLERVQRLSPDLVVTDMQMPEMDGLELLDRLQLVHPELPVIMMTGQGSEGLAVKALEHGATSYVPKADLAHKLVETVRQVLELTQSERSYKSLLDCLADARYRFYLRNDPALITPLVEMVQQMVFGMGICDWPDCTRMGIALDEALFNAIYHGNLELPVQQLQTTRTQIRAGNVADFLEQRASETPYCDRAVYVEISFSRDQVQCVIRDEGPGFNVIQNSHGKEADDSAGRGLILIRKFMDTVHFNDKGNELTLTRHRQADQVT